MSQDISPNTSPTPSLVTSWSSGARLTRASPRAIRKLVRPVSACRTITSPAPYSRGRADAASRRTRVGRQPAEQCRVADQRRQVRLLRHGDGRHRPGRILDLDRVRDVDSVSMERVPDGRAHLILRERGTLHVLHEAASTVGDRRGAEVEQQHVRAWRRHRERHLRDRVDHHRLHVIGRRGVRHADVDEHARRRRRFRVVDDGAVGDAAVGQRHERALARAQHRGPPRDLRHASFVIARPESSRPPCTAGRPARPGPRWRCRACSGARGPARPRRRRQSAAIGR